MSNTKITMYGTTWCGDCRRAKDFLERHEIPYLWINVDLDTEGLNYVKKINDGKRIVPTIILEDGSVMVEPTNAELANKLTRKCDRNRNP